MLQLPLIRLMMKDGVFLLKFLLISLFLLVVSCSGGTDSVSPPPVVSPLVNSEDRPPADAPAVIAPSLPPALADLPAASDSISDFGSDSSNDLESPLARDALLAAFSMIRDSADLSDDFIDRERSQPKATIKKDNSIRAAILIPMTGPAKTIGEDLQRVANLAVFTLQNKNINLTFYDTGAGVENAMAAALSQQVDVIIGPLFAEDTKRVKGLALAANIPMLSLSNDRSVAGSGVWVLGQTPEQEVAAVLAFALDRVTPIGGSGMPSLMIVTQESEYGQRMGQYAADFIRESGKTSADILTLSDDILNNEAALRRAIRRQVKWVKSTQDKINVPYYDMVLIAGDVPFSLRVSPVLSWYDLDSERVQYLGSSLWNRPAILQEPSLVGGWFAGAPSPHYKRFQKIWKRIFPQSPSLHAVLIFDAIAMVSASDYSTPELLRQSLINPDGFIGFGGRFKLLADGNNIRSLEIREIKPNAAEIIAVAGDKF